MIEQLRRLIVSWWIFNRPAAAVSFQWLAGNRYDRSGDQL